jgi:hypothetical protein
MRRVLIVAAGAAARPFTDLVEATALAGQAVDPLDTPATGLARGGFDIILAAGPASPSTMWGEAIIDFVHAGGGLVAGRPATAWFEGWAPWVAFIGARPEGIGRPAAVEPAVTVTVSVQARRHPIVAGLGPVLRLDEAPPRYGPVHDADVVATCDGGPVVWAASRGGGRVVVDALAYDAGSLSLRTNQVILQRALRWVGES